MSSSDKSRPLSTRGHILSGIVVSDRAKRTVIVQRDMVTYIPRYRRYARAISKIPAHNPDDIAAGVGDVVEIMECRKISKTKAWTVVKILEKGKGRIEVGTVKLHDEKQYTKQEKGAEPAAKQVSA
jgi:small subunit ribosomal protein S17